MNRERIEQSFFKFGRKTLIVELFLFLIMCIGLGNYVMQLKQGLILTDLSQKIFWGVYITNFIFFIGISHAGTLISAILRLTETSWRAPITRIAESITILALLFGASSVLIDMGHIDRIGNMFVSPNLSSPLIWDLISILLYLIGSTIFFLLPLIPDVHYYQDRLPDKQSIRRKIYAWLARGWSGNEEQNQILLRNIRSMSIIIIPVMVSVHTIIAWIMSLTSRVGWSSTLFGPYFVIGAIYSGIATIIMAMALFTHFYKLEEYITKDHFLAITKLLLLLSLSYFYFTLSEYLTLGYKSQTDEIELLHSLYYGKYASLFWIFNFIGIIIPVISMLVIFKYKEYLSTTLILWITFIIALLVNVGMWIKRYLITVPTLARQSINEGWHDYFPSSVEIWISISQYAGFAFFLILLSKLFPIISIWELEAMEEN
ncbi:MAG: polysulfide reductase NrfD [Candidatus Heimdallarchaeota archaeon]|nr:polysulfide reductase NrfD [Candidatus Heimdallarchaeota archaeon]